MRAMVIVFLCLVTDLNGFAGFARVAAHPPQLVQSPDYTTLFDSKKTRALAPTLFLTVQYYLDDDSFSRLSGTKDTIFAGIFQREVGAKLSKLTWDNVSCPGLLRSSDVVVNTVTSGETFKLDLQRGSVLTRTAKLNKSAQCGLYTIGEIQLGSVETYMRGQETGYCYHVFSQPKTIKEITHGHFDEKKKGRPFGVFTKVAMNITPADPSRCGLE